jgi:hypothetical protein
LTSQIPRAWTAARISLGEPAAAAGSVQIERSWTAACGNPLSKRAQSVPAGAGWIRLQTPVTVPTYTAAGATVSTAIEYAGSKGGAAPTGEPGGTGKAFRSPVGVRAPPVNR